MTKRSSKSLLLFMAMGLVSGLLSPIQTSINSQLRLTVGSPFVASFISFL
ncbi:TPA: DMT family transporter, partial [Listeria monocytogenes]|nr:DMT family transporter [Listeria monocytogenes]